MVKKWIGILALTAALFLLGGCSFSSPEDLYAVPRAAEDYKNLQDQIDKVRAAGAEYASPISGNYTQPIQLMDLDGDGVQEAVAFFRTTGADASPPLQIYIYRQTAEGDYEVWNTIEGDGTAINFIAYEDLDGHTGPDGNTDKELVVSWRLSDRIYLMMAYSVWGPEPGVLLPAVSYTDYAIVDMDKDNQKELVTLNLPAADNISADNIYMVDYYDYQNGEMALRSSAPLSKGILGLVSDSKPRAGYLRNGETSEPAIFITCNLSSGVITDIFAWRDDALVNITLNPTVGVSNSTFSLNSAAAIRVRDINGDDYLEVPHPTALPGLKPTGTAENFWSVQWLQYDLWGTPTVVSTTYYNGEDGWYLVLPESWQGEIALSRQDSSGTGERGVLFYPYSASEEENAAAKPFLAIYKLTGPNKYARAHAGGRFILLEQDDVIYAAEFGAESGWDCGVDQETLTGLFRLIQPDYY